MENQKNKIIITVIIETQSLQMLKTTLENLENSNFSKDEYIVAIKNNENKVIMEYCKNSEIQEFLYDDIIDVYYKLPEEKEFDYISFIKAGDIYDFNNTNKQKKKICTQLKDEDIFTMPIIYDEETKYPLNTNIQKEEQIFIEDKPNKIWCHISSVFFSKDLLKKLKEYKTENIKYYFEKDILTKLITINGGYKVLSNVRLKTNEPLENIFEGKKESYDRECFFNIFKFVEDLAQFSNMNFGKILNYIQYIIIYSIKDIFTNNANMRNKQILKESEVEEFFLRIGNMLNQYNVDNKIIMDTIGNKKMNYFILSLKDKDYKKRTTYENYENSIYVMYEDIPIFNASKMDIQILLMDYIDEKLIITARYNFPFDEKKLSIFAKYDNKLIEAKKNYVYSDYKVLGKVIYSNYTFDIEIPLKRQGKDEKKYIEFYISNGSNNVKLNIKFLKPLARLSRLKYAYWSIGNYTLNYRNKGILVMENTKLRHFSREIKFLIYLLKSKSYEKKYSAIIRMLYHITKPFYKKEIWLFEDKIYKGGDNGEYLYTYASNQEDGISKYYILKKGCIDAKRFKKENKKYVKFGSLYHKLLFLNSNIVFETHNNFTKQHSFDDKIERFFRDLYNSKNVCIQHGLTTQSIAYLTNRINDNLKRYYLASPVEKMNIQNKEYDYNGKHEEILKLTGCPRYDGLKNNDQKQILITPTWRNYLALPSIGYGKTRRYNNDFIKSDYFKIYNSIINDKKLIEKAKETGYKIIYLLHPVTSSQINDYDRNNYVKLIAATDDLNYEDILTKSSLMVTDYSGVQFDFAYMYKPIVYFHPNELPPTYEEGAYKYETMSLGEIVKDKDKLINVLCEYMDNDCKIKDEYRKRIDNFFVYHDYNNSKRVYDNIMKSREQGK